MPFQMLKSRELACPLCNPENKKDDGTLLNRLFTVEGEGKNFFFCGTCLSEFTMENNSLKQTIKIELENQTAEPISIQDFEVENKNTSESTVSDVITEPEANQNLEDKIDK